MGNRKSRRLITGSTADFIRSITQEPIDSRGLFSRAEGQSDSVAESAPAVSIDDVIRRISPLPETTELLSKHGFGVLALAHFDRDGLTPQMLLRAVEGGLDALEFKRSVINGLDVAEFARNLQSER